MTLRVDLSLQWILSAIGFVTAFLVGLWQYRRAQRQQKIALLLPLISEFETDEEIQAACHLFDYDAGTFTLDERKYPFKNTDLLEAMRVVEWDEDWSPIQAAMRDVMDRYFDFFTKLASFTDIGLLTFRDLKYFFYYFELLAGIEKYKGSGFEQALNRYLDAYRFGGCRKCLDAYRRLPPSLREELQLVQQSGYK
ncbi:MAG: hypothetical protein ABR988_08705 [Terriglobales bacterium]|jgi:hypothetical protein